MKINKILNLLGLIFVILIMVQIVNASAPLIDTGDYRFRGFFTNEHKYSVIYDNEGEAAVIAQLNFFNNGNTDIDTIRLEVPGHNIRVINTVQQYYAINDYQYCVEGNNKGMSYPVDWGKPDCTKIEIKQKQDLRYDRLSVYQQYTGDGIYMDLKLKEKLKSQQYTTIFIYYKSTDYAKKEYDLFGNLYKFNFQTIKTDFDIDIVNVGISVNEGLYLKDKTYKVNYAQNFAASSMLMQKSAFSESEMSSFGSNSYWIGQGQIRRSALSLDPHENFAVSGGYSDSWLSINYWNLFFIFLICAVILFGFTFAFVKAYRIVKTENIVWKSVSAGFIYAFALVGSWVLFFVLLLSSNFLRHSEGIMFLIAILLVILSLILIIAPPIYFAVKYKPAYMVWYLAAFFVSVVIIVVVAVFAYWLLSIANVFDNTRFYL